MFLKSCFLLSSHTLYTLQTVYCVAVYYAYRYKENNYGAEKSLIILLKSGFFFPCCTALWTSLPRLGNSRNMTMIFQGIESEMEIHQQGPELCHTVCQHVMFKLGVCVSEVVSSFRRWSKPR